MLSAQIAGASVTKTEKLRNATSGEVQKITMTYPKHSKTALGKKYINHSPSLTETHSTVFVYRADTLDKNGTLLAYLVFTAGLLKALWLMVGYSSHHLALLGPEGSPEQVPVCFIVFPM